MSLQEALKSLCHQNGWCYAAFWRLKRRNRMILTWEDVYYEFAKSSLAMNDSSCGKLLFDEFDTKESLFHQGFFDQELCYEEDKIGLALAKMSYQVYLLGEGIIGHVAFTGKHQWVVRRKNYFDKSNSINMFEYPAAWKNQFECGIKTIAVVAVVPHGVVQLGSMQMIMEDLEFLSYIRTVFKTLQKLPGAFLSDCLQEPVNEKIHGSSSQTIFIPPTGSPCQVETRTANSCQGFCGLYENRNSNSRSLSNATEERSEQSETQQTNGCIDNFTCSIIIRPGTKREQTEILPMHTRPVSPIQGIIGLNTSFAATQYAPRTGLDIRKNSIELMEHSERGINLQGYSQLPWPSAAVQSSSIVAAIDETLSLNSNIDQFELYNNGELLGGPMYVAGISDLNVLQHKSASLAIWHSSGKSESSASLTKLPYANQSTVVDLSLLPKVAMNVDSAYKYPPISSGCIQTCVFDSGQPLGSSSIGYLDMGPLDIGNNGLLDGLTLSDLAGIDQQPWVDKIGTQYITGFIEDSMVENLDCMEGSSSELGSCIESASAIRDDHNMPDRDESSDYTKVLRSRGQENVQHGSLSETEESLQSLELALAKETVTNACDENLLHTRKKSKVRMFPQSFGISSNLSCFSNVMQSSNRPVQTIVEGGILYDTKHEHLSDAVVGNTYPRASYSADDNIYTKIKSSVLSGTVPFCTSSARKHTCSAGKVWGLKQTQSMCSSLSQCMVDKGNPQNSSYNFDNPDSVKRGHIIAEEVIDGCSSVTLLSSSIDGSQSSMRENSVIVQAKQSDSMVKVSRKRATPGESGRPRPKDRQQIQDRVKELRDIIPNGTKCSVDSLLERTIKHMIFLQSLTKHAENLKQSGEKKV